MSGKLLDDFEVFYKAYPRKVNRGQAEKTWKKLKPKKEDLDLMLEALEWQKNLKTWQEKQYIPHPSTWLNGKRWLDEYDSDLMVQDNKKGNGNLSRSQKEELMKIQALKRFKMRGE